MICNSSLATGEIGALGLKWEKTCKFKSCGRSRKVKKNKTPEIVKQELLASIVEHSDGEEDYLELNEEVNIAKEPKDITALVKKYEHLLKGANKKIINIVGKKDELLKRFRDEEEFFDRTGLSRSNIYFKISLYKSLRKFP